VITGYSGLQKEMNNLLHWINSVNQINAHLKAGMACSSSIGTSAVCLNIGNDLPSSSLLNRICWMSHFLFFRFSQLQILFQFEPLAK